MVHLIFDRPSQSLKVYEPNGKEWQITASGDAWGPLNEHDGPIPEGHYQLPGGIELFTPIASEGAGQIDVADMGMHTAATLIADGKAKQIVNASTASGGTPIYEIGGASLRIGMLEKFDRSDVMIHGGGSNAPDPFAPHQVLCKTEGCTRVFNADFPRLVALVERYRGSNTIVFSCIGIPKAVDL